MFTHCSDILDSVWLFLWYIDKTTEETDGEGLVLGRMPIADSKPATDLGMPVKKVRGWRIHLTEKGYVLARRTPYGHVITVLKSKKRTWAPTLVEPKATERDLPKQEISTNGAGRENSQNGHRDLPIQEVRIPDPGSQSAQTKPGHCWPSRWGR